MNNFIEKAKNVHGEKYDYSLVNYINNRVKVKILCSIHGAFYQRPDHHLSGSICPSCSKNKKKDTNLFIQESLIIHHNKYDYSLVEYQQSHKKIKIICKTHGEFSQTPRSHLNGAGCPKCAGNNRKTKEESIQMLIKTHGDKYDYSLVIYNGSKNKIKILCKEHGVFEQIYLYHQKGYGCPKCAGKNRNNQEFILDANKVHNDKYDYTNIEYLNSNSILEIVCKKHGIFKQKASNHLSGQGCPICRYSKGELQIFNFLLKKNIEYISQYKFEDCKNVNPLPFDFYLPKLNICIEYNGIQHYEPISIFGGEVGYEKLIYNDIIKKNYCIQNNIKLITISYSDNILKKLEEII